jgi:putative protease
VSRVHALRRDAIVALEELRRGPRERAPRRPPAARLAPLPTETLDFTWNVANRVAEAFYRRAGATAVEGAAEVSRALTGRVVMTTRHCLRYELGWCQVWSNQTDAPGLPEPRGRLFLENGRTRLLCKFDCDRCRMELLLLT